MHRQLLINIDKDPRAIVPGPPEPMVILIEDIGMMSAMVIPIAIFVM